MRRDISHKINRLPLKYFDTTSYGDILSRVTNDIDTLGQTLNQSIGNLTGAVTLLAGSTIMMFVTDWRLAFTAIGSSLVGFILMSFILMRSQKYFTKQQQLLGQINGHVEEVYAGHNVVKVYNAEKPLGKVFDGLNQRLFSCAWKSQFMSGIMMPLMRFVGNLGYVAVCVVGAVMALNGDITFGVIVAFMIYIRLFTQPLSQIAQSFTSLQATAAASYRFFEFLDEEEMPDESRKELSIENVRGDIEFRNVRFGYDKEKTIIHDFSASVKAGQKIAIVGPTGAGKTTMVNLLMRFYDVDSGQILVDGVSLNAMPREKVRELFCMVLQDTWMFEGTIRQNIAYNKPDVTDEEIIKVANPSGRTISFPRCPRGTIRCSMRKPISPPAASAADHRARRDQKRADADPGRSDKLRGYPHRTAAAGGDGSADDRAYVYHHCAPAVHHPQRRSDSGDERRRYHRKRYARRAAETGRLLCRSVQQPV